MQTTAEIIKALVDKEPEADKESVRAELVRRLTEPAYHLCEAFDRFKFTCCFHCHTVFPQYDMATTTINDGTPAWLCCEAVLVLKQNGIIERYTPTHILEAKSDEAVKRGLGF